MFKGFYFERAELAKRLADELTGEVPFSDAPNGLFLAAPRRTGKSVFIKDELGPELERRGIVVIYVDLWEYKDKPPATLVSAKIADAMRDLVSKVLGNVKTLEFMGFKIELGKIGTKDGLSFYKALDLLRKKKKQPVALMIDEAQHALTDAEGENMMSALKSARDQMREKGKPGLLLVMTGSHRDKLSYLLNTTSAPFWGSEIRTLPTLGDEFALFLSREIKKMRHDLLSIRDDNMIKAFRHFGERPQLLLDQIARILPEVGDAEDFDKKLLQAARKRKEKDREEYTKVFLMLGKTEQAVLWQMLDKGKEFRPFAKDALEQYSGYTAKKVSALQAQRALENLQNQDPPLVWKTTRGDYSLYDLTMAEWYEYLANADQWPPQN